ncbi:protein get1 [Hyaloscypha sp. PMI_1271]|nr:protein get1 [Hyaloscypha sp. PMI_1271]
MPSLLLTVFLLQLAIHLVNTFGASSINAVLWNLYNSLPSSKSESSAEQRELKSQYLKVRKELNATSSQDQFAKWAKLRRQHDRLLEQLDKNKASTDSTRATFDSAVSTLRWIGTNGLRMFLQFWYSKQAMFWIPKGWVPYYAEWLLSFPRAPLGSISIQAWFLACTAVIILVSDALVAIVAMVAGLGSGTAQEARKEPVGVPSEKAASEEKKEL